MESTYIEVMYLRNQAVKAIFNKIITWIPAGKQQEVLASRNSNDNLYGAKLKRQSA